MSIIKSYIQMLTLESIMIEKMFFGEKNQIVPPTCT